MSVSPGPRSLQRPRQTIALRAQSGAPVDFGDTGWLWWYRTFSVYDWDRGRIRAGIIRVLHAHRTTMSTEYSNVRQNI